MSNQSIYKTSEECEKLIEKISLLFPQFGKVRSMVTYLNNQLDGSKLRPIILQRVQRLLDENLNRSFRYETIQSIDFALKKVGELDINKNFKKEINDKFKIETELNDDINLAIKNISEQNDIPFLVVKFYLEDKEINNTGFSLNTAPDWSWQEKAVKNVIRDIRENVGKYGLIIPTGGGKTRIANKIIIKWLLEQDGEVLWVTHRNILLSQAETSLVNLMDEMNISRSEQLQVRKKCHYASNLSYQEILRSENLSLIIIDEAHHAAASTYEEIIQQNNANVVMLTATPNRRDEQEIGIDKISFQISYKELFKSRCIIEPIFEKPYYINDNIQSNNNYDDEDLCKELAKYVLKRLNTDINKCLICVRKISYVENIFKELKNEYSNNLEAHRLDPDQIQFIHGQKNSRELSTNQFLKINSNEKNGILVATKDLIGEGFDDPFIDSVFITYPAQSITDLMQMGGRALRHSPGKFKARIIQVHQSKLAYHFNNRWLYQDISDNLRPRLVDITYSSNDERNTKLIKLLKNNNVSDENLNKILEDLNNLTSRDHFRMILLGYDFHEQSDDFEKNAQFYPMIIHDNEYDRFKQIFNEVSFHNDVSEVYDYKKYFQLRGINETNKMYSFYTFLLFALNKSRKEISNPSPYLDARNYFQTASEGNTWIKYINFYYDEKSDELNFFLNDCVNKDEILNEYSDNSFYSIIKISYPVHSARAFLLKKDQDLELNNFKNLILTEIKGSENDQFQIIEKLKSLQSSISFPVMIFNNIHQFLSDKFYSENYLKLSIKE